ncbi:MAG: DUF5674 family protein [Patescibacteria group bacterium]
MILILKDKATEEQIKEVTKIYPGYTKVVVDIEKGVLAAGGEYHIGCEQELLENGSIQENLWGGGFRFESKEVDFIGLTNYKVGMSNFSYEVSIPDVRDKMEIIIRKVFDNE